MADKKISALTGASTPLAGTEVLPIVQSGATVKVAVSDLTAGRAVSASSLTTSGNAAIATSLTAQNTITGAAEVGTSGMLLSFSDPSVGVGNNFYFNGGWKYKNAGTAQQIQMPSGGSEFALLYTAAGSAGGAISWSTAIATSSGIVVMPAYGAGAATFNASGVISSVSDETWKIKDGAPVNPDVMIQKLEPGYWFYNDEKKDTFGKERQLGFYAQNVHEAIGEEAAPTPEKYKDENKNDTDVTKPWGYYDRSVLAVAVMSLKNALTTIEELKQRIEVLENK
jgi:hypothetical protein